MDLKDIHDFILLVLDKERGGFVSHAEIDSALDRAQIQCFAEYYDGFGVNQKLHDALSVFKAAYVFTNSTSVSGAINLPADYLHLLNINTTTFSNTYGNVQNGVRMIQENELANALQSQLRKPTTDYPIATLNGGGTNKTGVIQLFPMQAQAGTIYYLRRPAKPNYSYSMTGRIETYDANASTQLEFLDEFIDKIIFKSLSTLGINLNETEQVQYAEMKEKEVA